MKKHLPNAISLARICFSLYSIYLFKVLNVGALLLVFFLLGVSDWADGFLSRRWKCTSRLGAILDPLGDKLGLAVYLIGIYRCLAEDNLYLILLLLLRDTTLIVGFSYLFMRGYTKYPKVSFIGKMNTLVVGLYVLAALTAHYTQQFSAVTYLWKESFFYLALLTTAWSFLDYVLQGMCFLRKR